MYKVCTKILCINTNSYQHTVACWQRGGGGGGVCRRGSPSGPTEGAQVATFCLVLDTIISSLNCRFKQNENIFKAFPYFPQTSFRFHRYSTTHDLKLDILFYENYGIDAGECDRGLWVVMLMNVIEDYGY